MKETSSFRVVPKTWILRFDGNFRTVEVGGHSEVFS